MRCAGTPGWPRPRRRQFPGWPPTVGAILSLALLLAALVAPAASARPVADEEAPPSASLPPPSGALPPGVVYLAETGHYLRGPFLAYWRERGGAAIFGYPLSEEYEQVGADGVRRTVQLFDKARFELHDARGDNGGGAQVLLGLLGREALGPLTFPPAPPFPPTSEREYVAATGFGLGFGFRDFWRANDGLRLLGWPISDETAEGALTVQYFERGRLEYDPGLPPERRVSMAPLGAQLLERRGWPRPARITFALREPAAAQGGTIVVDLQTDRATEVEMARFDDRPVAFFGDRFARRALVGLSPSERVGMHSLSVTVREEDGTLKTLAREVFVRETPFPRQRIYLPPGLEDLLDPAVAEREQRIVAPLYEIVTPEQLWRGPFVMPAQGPITTEFGEARAYNDGPFASWHNGLDIGAPAGAPIVAPAPGRVVYAGRLDIRGNFVAIDHGQGVLTCYFHQSRLAVGVGQFVNTGEVIGYVGTTGLSTGPHLHWEVRIAGVPVSPWSWVVGEAWR